MSTTLALADRVTCDCGAKIRGRLGEKRGTKVYRVYECRCGARWRREVEMALAGSGRGNGNGAHS